MGAKYAEKVMVKVAFEFSEKMKPGARKLEAGDTTAGVSSPRRFLDVGKSQLGKQKMKWPRSRFDGLKFT